jgi:hypothetical protein
MKTYLVKWFDKKIGLVYEKEIKATSKEQALKKMGNKVRTLQAIYLKLK